MNSSPLDATPVVTVFVYRHGQVLLVKRSALVGTYRGYWAGIAGYLERQPVAQARLELREEAGLRTEDVSLRGIGCPLVAEDPDVGHPWLVYTFLFRLREGARVRTDWEAEAIEWVAPSEVARRQTVPGLADGLARVWPPWGSDLFWREMEAIATDAERGATGLALQGLRAVNRLRATRRRRGLLAFASLHPSMGLFPHIAARALSARARIGDMHRSLDAATTESAHTAARTIAGCRRVLTHSFSRPCRDALIQWWRPGREVVATESRPRREGLALARELASASLQVKLISDAAAGLFIPRCDAVLVGADAIGADGHLINKVGTRPIALAARESRVPCYAVTQTHKICPTGWPLTLAPQDPRDLASARGVRVHNIAFDATPLDWFTSVLTERGPLTSDLMERVQRSLGPWERWVNADQVAGGAGRRRTGSAKGRGASFRSSRPRRSD